MSATFRTGTIFLKSAISVRLWPPCSFIAQSETNPLYPRPRSRHNWCEAIRAIHGYERRGAVAAAEARSCSPAIRKRGAMVVTRITLFVMLVCLCAAPLRGDDARLERLQNWHQWRGPEANGTAPMGNPPVHWDTKTNIRWKAALPGRGSSTPIVWRDQVFVVTAVETA